MEAQINVGQQNQTRKMIVLSDLMKQQQLIKKIHMQDKELQKLSKKAATKPSPKRLNPAVNIIKSPI